MKSRSSKVHKFTGLMTKFVAWNKRNFATWWLWIPLLFASFAFVNRQDRWADMYEIARSAPRFVREGVVDDIGIRGRWMQLRMPQAARRISCEAAGPRSRDTYCLPRARFPLYVKTTLVDYQGVWLIISASDENKVILKEDKQLRRLKRISDYSKSREPFLVFFENFALAFVVGGGLALLARRRRKKLQEASNHVN